MTVVKIDTDKYIIIPKETMDSFDTLEDLEGWLISHNRELLEQLDRSQEQYESGDVKTLEEVFPERNE